MDKAWKDQEASGCLTFGLRGPILLEEHIRNPEHENLDWNIHDSDWRGGGHFGGGWWWVGGGEFYFWGTPPPQKLA
eukprot:1158638-Pelagomonas_calceolata.AAC.2